ncbi:transposase [Carnobacterium sp. ISL-102]|uniref:transposase n=1 Tax=Carnobacterium sp. ISL-102 TaxID=2819142 RepID=UPI001BE5A6AD|nr:transposase [Carnobacterium sp. ISL-102]MBT2731938.1 transposase [Carnobacterium sp. ISL-102]
MRNSYSYKFKLKAVIDYLEGLFGYISVAGKNEMPSVSPLKRWVNAYKTVGPNGVRKQLPMRNSVEKHILNTIKGLSG